MTFGRTTTLSNKALSAYHPVASVAFSQIGFSAAYGAFGASPTSRIATALTYRLTYENLRFAVQAQVGGYDMGNAATEQYQGQVGFDYGIFSLDAIGGWAQNAVSLSSYSGAALPAGLNPNSIVRATVQNTGGFALLARYQWEKFKFYGAISMSGPQTRAKLFSQMEWGPSPQALSFRLAQSRRAISTSHAAARRFGQAFVTQF